MPFASMDDFRRQMKEAAGLSEEQKQADVQKQLSTWFEKHREQEMWNKQLANMAVDLFPIIGDVKGVAEAVVGKTALGEPMKWWERGISAAGALPLVPSVGGWFHPLQRLLEVKMPKSAVATDVMRMLRSGGIKEDEIKWSWIESYLQGKTKVEKSDLLDYLRANQVEMKEIVNKEIPPMQYKIGGPEGTKFSPWQLPGGENYREYKFQLEPQKKLSDQVVLEGVNDKGKKILDFMSQDQAIYSKEVLEKQGYKLNIIPIYEKPEYPLFSGSHWDEPNILFHTRVNDRVDAEGKRVFFLEEVQSDWHQVGREKGYKRLMTDAEYDRYKQLLEKGEYQLSKRQLKLNSTEQAELDELNRIYNLSSEGVSPAPFSKTWHETAIRRMIREAATQGEYDKIGWTTGEQQAERYNQLLKDVNRVVYKKEGNLINVVVYKKDMPEPVLNKMYEKENISDIQHDIGKTVAVDVIEDKGSIIGRVSVKGRVSEFKELKYPDGITIGGEGMKGFYDKMMVDYMNKIGKKYGVKVQDTYIPPTGLAAEVPFKEFEGVEKAKEGITVHSLPLTPQMKADYSKEIPLFSILPLLYGPGTRYFEKYRQREEQR